MNNLTIKETHPTQPLLKQARQNDAEEFRENHPVRRFETEAVPHFPHLKRLALHLTRNPT
jgi:hypothetical protein